MRINALLDLDMVAVESADRVSVLLDLTAPDAPAAATRPPRAVQIVLDRSGSMAGDRLGAARAAIDALITRLDPHDAFGLVTFDDGVDVAVPAQRLHDKAAVRRLVAAIEPGGMTNLSGGLLRGLQEAERGGHGSGATCILLSDGYANHGVTDRDALGGMTAAARAKGIGTSTIGLGLDYDEALLAAVARGGAGDADFAEDADAAGAALATQVDGLLQTVVQAASLTVKPTGDVSGVTLFNDLPATAVDGGVMVELGDFVSGEQRKLLIDLDVPAMPGLGLAQIAELELRWVELPALVQKTVTIPLHVNVLPGDQAAGRIPDATVRSEKAFQTAQQAKRQAAEALRRGDAPAAAAQFAAAARCMPAEHAGEAELLRDLAERALHDDVRRTAKFTEADAHRKNRRRGR